MEGSGCRGVAVQKHWRPTLERAEKFISDTYFTDVNLRGRQVLLLHDLWLYTKFYYRAINLSETEREALLNFLIHVELKKREALLKFLLHLPPRLYPHHTALSTVRWYDAGCQHISFHAAVQALDHATEVATKDVSIGPT